jgi:hypothetical protein
MQNQKINVFFQKPDKNESPQLQQTWRSIRE